MRVRSPAFPMGSGGRQPFLPWIWILDDASISKSLSGSGSKEEGRSGHERLSVCRLAIGWGIDSDSDTDSDNDLDGSKPKPPAVCEILFSNPCSLGLDIGYSPERHGGEDKHPSHLRLCARHVFILFSSAAGTAALPVGCAGAPHSDAATGEVPAGGNPAWNMIAECLQDRVFSADAMTRFGVSVNAAIAAGCPACFSLSFTTGKLPAGWRSES